jgi:zinc protease
MNHRHARRTALVLAMTVSAASSVPRPSGAQTPPSTTADTGTVGYDVAGVSVIQRFATTSEIVVANLYLLGGVRQVSAETAGIELLMLEASERGTRTYGRDRLRRAMARLGTSIVLGANEDWTSIGVRATRATFDSTWKIFASRVMEPLFDSADVELVRAQLLAGVRQRQDSPDALVEFLADSFAFAGHPYGIPVTGTEQSLSRITPASLRQYHADQVVNAWSHRR